MSTEPFPPFPDDESALEAMMKDHLEPVAPSPELAARTLESLRGAVPAQPPAAARASAWGLIALAAALLLTLGGVIALTRAAPPPPPSQPTREGPPILDQEPDAPPSDAPRPPSTPVETAQPPSTSEEPLPAEAPQAGDLRIRLVPGEPGPSADFDYGALKVLLGADVIVIGTVEDVEDSGAGTLRVGEVLRGQREELLTVSTAGEFTGCEGAPDLTAVEGEVVCLFLLRGAEGLSLLHGASGVQRLPYRGKLPADALRAIVTRNALDAGEVEALVAAQGPGVLDWLRRALPGLRIADR